MDILQLAVQQLLTTNDNVTAANIAFPKAFCSYDEQTPDDPSSYVVVPYDPQLCSIVQVCVRIKTPTSPFYPDGHHAITIQYYDRDATQPPRIFFTNPMIHYAIDPHTFSINPQQMQHFVQRCDNNYSLPNIVAQLEYFFAAPLHPCEHCNLQMTQYAEYHYRNNVQLAAAYRSIRTHKQQQQQQQQL